MKILPLLNFEETFRSTIRPMLVPCDASVLRTKSQTQEFIKYIFSESDMGDLITVTCDCGECTDRYTLGTRCEECGGVVREPNFLELGYRVWLPVPDCLPPLMQPAAFKVFGNWMHHKTHPDLLDAFLGKEGTCLPVELADRFKPGAWYFYNHFDEIMNYLLTEHPTLREYTPAKRGGRRIANDTSISMRKFIEVNRDAIFTRYFPALDNRLHVLSKEGTLALADKASDYILSMAIDMANINLMHSITPNDTIKLEQAAYKLVMLYDEYASTILNDKLLSKYGLIRRHIMGVRCHFTFRAVITPMIELTRPDELHLPWRVGIIEFKLEILNLLINRYKLTLAKAISRHECALDNYDKDIDAIFQTLIKECPYRGMPCIFGRNPTMLPGAIQFLYVTKIKTDLHDDTISFSHLICSRPNADYDGDAKLNMASINLLNCWNTLTSNVEGNQQRSFLREERSTTIETMQLAA